MSTVLLCSKKRNDKERGERDKQTFITASLNEQVYVLLNKYILDIHLRHKSKRLWSV